MRGRTWVHQLRLRAEIALWRHGWGSLIVIALAGLAAGTFAMHRLWTQEAAEVARRTAQLTDQIQAIRLQPQAQPSPTPEQERLAALRSTVYAKEAVTPLVREVFASAQRHGLASKETDFRLTTQGFGGLEQQQVVLPLQGSYPSFRSFVLDLLQSHPGISVDQIQIKREGVSQGEPEIRARLSIWTDPGKRDVPAQASKEGLK